MIQHTNLVSSNVVTAQLRTSFSKQYSRNPEEFVNALISLAESDPVFAKSLERKMPGAELV